MDSVRVLISSSQSILSDLLGDSLSEAGIAVISVKHGPEFVSAVHREHPQIVVMELDPDRVEAARVDIAVVKQMCPSARIIVVSRQSSAQDAEIVEAGIFYYLVDPSPRPAELVRVVRAAAAPSFKEAR